MKYLAKIAYYMTSVSLFRKKASTMTRNPPKHDLCLDMSQRARGPQVREYYNIPLKGVVYNSSGNSTLVKLER